MWNIPSISRWEEEAIPAALPIVVIREENHSDIMEKADEKVISIAQIETMEALENVEEIDALQLIKGRHWNQAGVLWDMCLL